MARKDMILLVKRLDLPRDEIILDLGAGSGAQVKQLRTIGYDYALGVDLVSNLTNLPFVQQVDMRKFVWQTFIRKISLISLRYSLHCLDIEDVKTLLIRVCTVLREGGYLCIVTFGKNDPIISRGYTIDEVISFIPKGMKLAESSREVQKDKKPYPHTHRIIRLLFKKEN